MKKTQTKFEIEENRQFKQKFKPCVKYSNHSQRMIETLGIKTGRL